MSKIASKPAAASPKAKVLYCESDSSVLTVASKLFERAGYMVDHAAGRATAEVALRKGTYDIVILGHTLTRDDRHHLPYVVKKANELTQVMVIHASGKHPAVDVAIDSRDGEKAMLAALASLAELRLAVAV